VAARLGLCRGVGLSTLIRQHFPRGVLYFAVSLVAIANTFNIAADLSSMGASAHLVVPVPAAVLTIAMTVLMLGLEVLVPYHRYSKVLRWLAASLVAYLFVLVSVDVDWRQVAHHALVPHLVGGKGGLAALLAVFGTTVSPYLFFWQASEEVEEATDHQAVDHRRATEAPTDDHLRAMRIDVIGGMVSACVIAFAIMVQAAQALQPFAGDLAGAVFALGVVGLGLLAVPVLAGSTAYAVSEALRWHEGLSKTFRQARGFYTVILFSMLVGLTLNFVGVDPIRGLYYAAILNGLTAPPLIVLMVVLARSRRMAERRSGLLSLTLCCIAVAVSAALPIAYVLS
jgi:Mn2+/Fe2+ NRAMP family transporter